MAKKAKNSLMKAELDLAQGKISRAEYFRIKNENTGKTKNEQDTTGE